MAKYLVTITTSKTLYVSEEIVSEFDAAVRAAMYSVPPDDPARSVEVELVEFPES